MPPSGPMKISTIIERLREIQGAEGDILGAVPDGNPIQQIYPQDVVKIDEPLGPGNPERRAILSGEAA